MAFFGKNLSIENLKEKVEKAKNKAIETADSIKDTAGSIGSAAMETGKDLGSRAIQAGDKATNTVKKIAEDTVDAVQNFDYETSKEKTNELISRGVDKTTDYFKKALEVDKTTMDVVQEIRSRLPTPVSTVDQIFDQCRDEAIRRAISAFMLGPILNNVDDHNALKYEKLSVNWQEFRKDNENQKIIGSGHENYASMKNAIRDEGIVVENGYNRDDPLIKHKGNIDVEHVTSRKELFSDVLLSIGLTNKELGDVINDSRNLVYADKKTNSQKSDHDLWTWVDKFKDDYQPDDNKIVITIKSTGEKRVLDKQDLAEAYEHSKKAVREARINAGIEVAATVVKSGVGMALQQVTGLIVVETLDIFMDEIKNFKLVTEDGFIKELQDKKERIYSRLDQRFEEKQIWARARELGIEAGVSGALSVLPQIIISLFVKMPAFIHAIIRESTLSVVRSVRVLCSNEEGKLDNLKVIMFGTASAIAGVYVQRVITTAISGVPLLNRFNSQISSILSGMVVMAIPLIAIYSFDQNKQRMMLRLKGISPDAEPSSES